MSDRLDIINELIECYNLVCAYEEGLILRVTYLKNPTRRGGYLHLVEDRLDQPTKVIAQEIIDHYLFDMV